MVLFQEMNITLSVDEQIILKARQTAQSMGKSINQLVRDYLAQLASLNDPQGDIEELERLTALGQGHSSGAKFHRDALYDIP